MTTSCHVFPNDLNNLSTNIAITKKASATTNTPPIQATQHSQTIYQQMDIILYRQNKDFPVIDMQKRQN